MTELFDRAVTCAEAAVLALGGVRDLSAGSDLRLHSLGARRRRGMPEDTEVFHVIRPEDVDFNAGRANT